MFKDNDLVPFWNKFAHMYRTLVLTLFAAVALGSATPALADYCGREGERLCTINEYFPSCATNLVAAGTSCIHPNCGAEGQSSCALAQRPLGASCDIVLVTV